MKTDWSVLICSIIMAWLFGLISIIYTYEREYYEATLQSIVFVPIVHGIVLSIMFLLGACEIDENKDYHVIG